jgi:hypothetical protein
VSYRYLSALATASASARFRAALNTLLALPLRWLKEGRHHSRIVREEYHQPNRGYVA